jgi:hypothetical protein
MSAETATAIAAGIGAIAACLALYGAWTTIKDTRRTVRERVTYESGVRFEMPELIKHKALMSSFLRGGLQPPSVSDVEWAAMNQDERLKAAADLWTELSESSALEDRERVLQILAFPNMLEAYAGMYNHDLFDVGIVKTRVQAEATSFWELGKWWVDEVRKQGDDQTIYRDLEVMIEDLAKQARPSPYEA